MPEPTTVNIALIVPNTGDLSGAWGTAALNPNFVAIDGILAGFATISLSSATTIALTAATGSLTPGAGPYQTQNALLKFTGSLTGNCTIQIPQPGRYIIDNRCTVGSFYVQISPSSGTGTSVGAPPGRKCTVFYDGTNVDYVDMPEVGSAMDLHGVTALPAWMTACTVSPYLIKDGSVYSTASYTALGTMLGSTFGGNGITTFGVPDERSRFRLALDTGATGRVTNATSGITGTSMGSAGGSQSLQAHSHTNTLNDPGHAHKLTDGGDPRGSVAVGGNINVTGASYPGSAIANSTTNISVTVNTAGVGGSQNMPPCIVSFLGLIKTAIALYVLPSLALAYAVYGANGAAILLG
jgi:microcystin-dependent protein